MNRSNSLSALQEKTNLWDVLIIGGGASGLGCALDASIRGHRTALVEAHDFAQATSSRSTKLVHGGVRYLKQGNISLVRDALEERGTLAKNAPRWVRPLPFVIPTKTFFGKAYYGIGLKAYDALAGSLGIGKSAALSADKAQQAIPNLDPNAHTGGIHYYDAQFDDARLAIELAKAASDLGAAMVNHVRAEKLIFENGRVIGASLIDRLTGDPFEVRAKVVLSATGVFVDQLRKQSDPASEPIIRASRGSHIVTPLSFLGGNHALMVPRTTDGRILFGIPWHGKALFGTTDVPQPQAELEPIPTEDEIDFILENAAGYLANPPSRDDIVSTFTGLRPLVQPASSSGNTSAISRDHYLETSSSGLITLAGGKWTTFRKMAEDAVNTAEIVGDLEKRECKTTTFRFQDTPLMNLEIDQEIDREIVSEERIRFAIEQEMATTIDDVLSRRIRCLPTDARLAREKREQTANLLASHLGWSAEKRRQEIEQFETLCDQYEP